MSGATTSTPASRTPTAAAAARTSCRTSRATGSLTVTQLRPPLMLLALLTTTTRSFRRSSGQTKALPLEGEEAIEIDRERLHPLGCVGREAPVVFREHQLLDRGRAVADDPRPVSADDVKDIAVEQEEAELLADCLTLDDELLRREAGPPQRPFEL